MRTRTRESALALAFDESEHPRDEQGKFTEGAGAIKERRPSRREQDEGLFFEPGMGSAYSRGPLHLSFARGG